MNNNQSGPATAGSDASHPYINMILTIQEQIQRAQEVAYKENPTLEELFDAIPDTIIVDRKLYQLQVTPLKGGLTFVDYTSFDNPTKQENLLHAEGLNLSDALCVMIRLLSKKENDNWSDC